MGGIWPNKRWGLKMANTVHILRAAMCPLTRPVLDDIIAKVEQAAKEEKRLELSHVPRAPVTCELITCIEAGVCDCEQPFKAVKVVGQKWALAPFPCMACTIYVHGLRACGT